MTHIMELTETHEGTETWVCPTCGRTYLIEWHPWNQETVVEGDAYALHSASKGGLIIGGIEVKSE